ncbi:MAG: hypothetical protein H6833_06070 [Planctomycetes bacterium]|nr:hypothetical protein [Planctomycetota bacterium]
MTTRRSRALTWPGDRGVRARSIAITKATASLHATRVDHSLTTPWAFYPGHVA